jgi:hypothetical protein
MKITEQLYTGKEIPNHIEKHVPFENILTIVQSLRLESFENLELCEKQHQLIFTETECGPPIAFYKSTQLSGFDIYIWESLREKGEDKIQFALVHELAEISIRYLHLDSENAHRIALLYEEKYLSVVSKEMRNSFLIFAGDLRNKYL